MALYSNLLLPLYFISLTWQISISIFLFFSYWRHLFLISVYGDVRNYCPLSLLHLSYLTYYYLLFFFSASTVLHLLSSFCLYVYCSCIIISLTLFSSFYIWKTTIFLLSSLSLFSSKFSKLNTVLVNDLYFRILLDNNNY